MLPLNVGGSSASKFPKKQACLSFFLVMVGLTLMNEGIVNSSTALVVLGIVVIGPGLWSAYVIVQTLREQPGYSFEQLPSYTADDES
mmetsp:Transcript_6077/g.12129  ORF Transcript_6077/g.12129 Transcript_6077/m.12129 type:complete len:87 (-) Transcript_6077:121-381(-)